MSYAVHGWIEITVASKTTIVNVVTLRDQNYYCLVQLGNALSEGQQNNSFQKMLAKQKYRHMFHSHEPIEMVQPHEPLKPVYRAVIPHRTGSSSVVISHSHVRVLAEMCHFMNCRKNHQEFLESFGSAVVNSNTAYSAALEARALRNLAKMHIRVNQSKNMEETQEEQRPVVNPDDTTLENNTTDASADTMQLTATIQRLRTQIMCMQAEHDKKIRMLNAKHDAEIAAMRKALREQHAIEIEQIRAEQSTAMSLF